MKKIAVALCVVSLFLLLLSGFLFYFTNRPIQTQTFPASVNLTQDVGSFDLSKGALTFGRLRYRDSAMRNLIFYNSYPFPVIVSVSVDGTITPFLDFESVFMAGANETKKIPFTIYTGESGPLGVYTGNVTFEIRRSYKKDI